jgi:hypothetical protein
MDNDPLLILPSAKKSPSLLVLRGLDFGGRHFAVVEVVDAAL